jgi:hypothetical protein
MGHFVFPNSTITDRTIHFKSLPKIAERVIRIIQISTPSISAKRVNIVVYVDHGEVFHGNRQRRHRRPFVQGRHKKKCSLLLRNSKLKSLASLRQSKESKVYAVIKSYRQLASTAHT